MVMVSLGCTGLDAVTRPPSDCRRTIGILLTGPAVPFRKMLGAVGRTTILSASLTPPGVRRTTSEFPLAWNGNCALIWVGETNCKGVTTPFTVRHESARTVGNGLSVLDRVRGLNWLPKIVTSPPGATGLVKSPELTS